MNIINTSPNRDTQLINIYNQHLIEYTRTNFTDNNIINESISEYLNNINNLTMTENINNFNDNNFINFNDNNINEYTNENIVLDSFKYNILKQKLKLKTKDISNDETKECSICLQNITNQACVLDCDHYFHLNCIKKWVKHKPNCPTCPTCRQNIKL